MAKNVLTRVYEMTGKAGTICPNVPDNPNPSPYKLCRGDFDDEAMLMYMASSQEDLNKLEACDYAGDIGVITGEEICPINLITNWHYYIMEWYDAFPNIRVGDIKNPRYKHYLRSDAWKRKRNAVMERAKLTVVTGNPVLQIAYTGSGKRVELIKFQTVEWTSICEKEGCSNTATVAHHLTYKNIGKENLEDLQALCRDCHWYKEHNHGRNPRRFETLDGRIVLF
ncbi:MAG: hypothetical protein OXI43_02745 [Candidatus Poribacteria bacterium]|nr:hypothetical protein [Candidatus Poribacteria bacterium]